MAKKNEETKPKNDRCPDCGVAPGSVHDYGCDVERCMQCGGQLLFCGCEMERYAPPTKDRERWTGEWPGAANARELGLFCYWDEEKGWVPCEKDHPEARPDLNRLEASSNRWNPKTRRWEKK